MNLKYVTHLQTEYNFEKKESFQSFEGFICLHIGKNHVEEDGDKQEEHNLNPHWDEAR